MRAFSSVRVALLNDALCASFSSFCTCLFSAVHYEGQTIIISYSSSLFRPLQCPLSVVEMCFLLKCNGIGNVHRFRFQSVLLRRLEWFIAVVLKSMNLGNSNIN